DPLALKLLEGEVKNGDHVVADGDLGTQKMTFQVTSPGAEAPGEPEMAGIKTDSKRPKK
ncbi:MAG: hypothetical protein JWN45_1422, partial [Acidobacteriaceae bacterium]|nr:hypothetical protein [Acidobacteriaceae bacterium]